ncbi:diguanylate cyclase [Shewanella marisflavi]|uniref:tetratricopeptide repeat-containing diguanylate cyclase n=1 Tax=Shewanella marisflavi TaxID=260364 RepID=UPI003AB05156
MDIFNDKLVAADQLRSSEPQKFGELLASLDEEVDKLSEEQKYYYNYLKAYQLSFKGEFDKAVALYKENLVPASPQIIQFRSNLSIINIFAISKNWTEGLSYLSKNLEMLPEIAEPEFQQLGLLVAALFYNQLGQYELGLRYANKLESIVNEDRNACLALQLTIEAKLKLHQLNENSPEINNSIAVCEKNDEALISAIINMYVAELLLEQHKNQQAIQLLEAQLDTIHAFNYAPVSSRLYSRLAQGYHALDQASKAETYASQAAATSMPMGNDESSVIAYRILYQTNLARNDYKAALDNHVKYAQADKAYLDDIKTKHLAFQLAEHQAAEQKSRIALLDRQNNLLLTEQQLAKTQAENTRLFISLLIAIITLLGFWAYKSWTIQKRLKQLAEFDALTHVFNRGHFTQVAQSALAYCESSDVDLSYILFDLDNFKQINDKYGHAVGDWVLKKVAKTCQAQGRKNDIFARIGGEEFCIALPGCDLQTAIKLAECCRKAIANIDCSETGHDFEVTASFGITDTQMSGFKLERLINDADSAMYQSKETGRDRICVFDPEAERAIPKASHTVLSL